MVRRRELVDPILRDMDPLLLSNLWDNWCWWIAMASACRWSNSSSMELFLLDIDPLLLFDPIPTFLLSFFVIQINLFPILRNYWILKNPYFIFLINHKKDWILNKNPVLKITQKKKKLNFEQSTYFIFSKTTKKTKFWGERIELVDVERDVASIYKLIVVEMEIWGNKTPKTSSTANVSNQFNAFFFNVCIFPHWLPIKTNYYSLSSFYLFLSFSGFLFILAIG